MAAIVIVLSCFAAVLSAGKSIGTFDSHRFTAFWHVDMEIPEILSVEDRAADRILLPDNKFDCRIVISVPSDLAFETGIWRIFTVPFYLLSGGGGEI